MKHFSTYFRFAAICAIASAALSCEKPKTDEPEVEPVACQQVHFAEGNQDFIILADKQTSIEVKVAREKTDAAITVPLKVNKTADGITVPETVSFAANAKEASFTVTLPSDVPVKTLYELEIELTGENVDAFLDGAETIYSTQISNPLKVKAKTYITGKTDRYGHWETELWIVSDSHIIMPDFWHSGKTVTLKEEARQGERIYMSYSADGGYLEADTDYPGCYWWYMYDKDDEDWIPLYPFGKDAWFSIDGMDFYFNDSYAGDDDMAWYQPADNYITFTMNTVYYSDKSSADYWNFVAIDWRESTLEGFVPDLPEQKAEASTEFEIWFASDPETKYTNMGDWQDNTCVIENFLDSSDDLKLSVDEDFKFTGYPGLYYDADYQYYYVYNACYCLGDWTYVSFYGPEFGSSYDKDSETFSLVVFNTFYADGAYTAAPDYDTLYVRKVRSE